MEEEMMVDQIEQQTVATQSHEEYLEDEFIRNSYFYFEQFGCNHEFKAQILAIPPPIRDNKIQETGYKEALDSMSPFYTKVVGLLDKKIGDQINTIGIVVSITEEKKNIYKNDKEITLMNFNLIDDSNFFVSVALWGRQAEKTLIKPGQLISFRRAQINDYGGISLTVQKNTEMNLIYQDMLSDDQNSRGCVLWKWWRTWYKSRIGRSINTLIQPRSAFAKNRRFDTNEDDFPSKASKKSRTE
jgi:hypothetical protein